MCIIKCGESAQMPVQVCPSPGDEEPAELRANAHWNPHSSSKPHPEYSASQNSQAQETWAHCQSLQGLHPWVCFSERCLCCRCVLVCAPVHIRPFQIEAGDGERESGWMWGMGLLTAKAIFSLATGKEKSRLFVYVYECFIFSSFSIIT